MRSVSAPRSIPNYVEPIRAHGPQIMVKCHLTRFVALDTAGRNLWHIGFAARGDQYLVGNDRCAVRKRRFGANTAKGGGVVPNQIRRISSHLCTGGDFTTEA